MSFAEELVAIMPALRREAVALAGSGEADDLLAETLCRSWAARDSYDRERPLLAWCRAIMRNLAYTQWRHGSLVDICRLGEWDIGGGVTADQAAICHELLDAIANCHTVSMATLADFAKGYSIAEIARMRNVPQGTVKRRIHDARQALRKLLED